jgi:hypothetical protein
VISFFELTTLSFMLITIVVKIFIDNGNHSNPALDIQRMETEPIKYLCISAKLVKYVQRYGTRSSIDFITQ